MTAAAHTSATDPLLGTGVDACFSRSYAQARQRFVDAAQAVGARQRSIPMPELPDLPDLRGANGEPLSTDLAYLGADDAHSLIVLSSGVHGVEGYCGSGCQIALLQDAELLRAAEQHRVAILLIHAVNPWGFSHGWRTNEDNIDLNRNFLDFEARSTQPPANPAYADLHPLLLPEHWPPTPENEQAIAAYISQHGMPAFQAAVSIGQSEFADGMFYSGAGPSWSHRTLRQIASDHLPQRRRIAWIDLHTGLGRCGHGEKIHCGQVGDQANLAAARQVWGADVVAPWEGESTSSQVVGHATGAMAEHAAPGASFVGIAMEYGSNAGLHDSMPKLRASHWLRKHPQRASAEQRAEIMQALRGIFYVEHPSWYATVAAQCRVSVVQAMLSLSRSAST